MLSATGLVGVAWHLDRTVVGSGFAGNQALRVKSAIPATAIGHALGNTAAVGIHEPGEIEHLAKWECAKVQIESGDQHIVIGIEQVPREDEQLIYKLSFIDGDALNLF